MPEIACKLKGLFAILWAMKGNETNDIGNSENSVFAGSSPAMRTNLDCGWNKYKNQKMKNKILIGAAFVMAAAFFFDRLHRRQC
jgi:hypothetical protein